ncbi:MAG: hypothetical protein ABIQ18_42000 [Umezawaea sp.]
MTLTAKADDADTVTIGTGTADPVLPLRLASPALGILAAKAYAQDAAPAVDVKAKTQGTALRLAAYTNRAEPPEVATILQQQLEKAGFTVQQDVREYTQMEADLLAGKYDALVFSRVTLLDTGDAVAFLASDFTSTGVYNIARLKDARVDQAIAAAAQESDTALRQQKIMLAEAEVLRTDAVVPLVHEKVVLGIGTRVEGVVLDPRERSLVAVGTHLK